MVWLLMLALPLQAVAAFAPLAGCGGDHAASAQQQSHDGHDGHGATAATTAHDHHAAGSHPHPGDDPAADPSGHSCCHHVFTGATSGMSHGSLEAPRTVIQRVSLLHTLHIPELPQRPPRA